MPKIALLNDFDITKRPRPKRMLDMLKGHYELYAIAMDCSPIEGVECFAYPASKNAKERSLEEQKILEQRLKNKDFLPLVYTPNRLKILEFFTKMPKMDLFIIEDITLLAFGLDYKKSYNPSLKILIDLREYYPLQYENDPEWMAGFGEFFGFLCREFLPHVDFAITVSEGIAQKYKEEFGLHCEVFHSLPPYHELKPNPLKTPINIIYHGFLSPDRNSAFLLEIAHQLRGDFCMQILGLSNIKGFLETLEKNAPKNVNFLAPVSMEEIIPFTNNFDIGILTLSPNTFNNAHALPNKFFEYIQARLALIAPPLPSLRDFLSLWQVGKMSQDFTPESLASTINALQKEEIAAYKTASDRAAKILNTTENRQKILRWIEGLLS
ncbi:glycosyltransferase family protein [Helicobacter mustelae]|uniref:Uncharacterized protein n=1 Tax=Helicobacter mustelae (strain ATCC 43772 / CCUG 25715 / CIP 103759 / LMG 18044 / NCTC 12198 / R85-136P) TaxID=679897 RepID=D3UI65_HELM1|nr:hypothetical protein [Helicobacter mustelae]CBG40188.1 Putative hypothetical protein [Helicobacter mustelae 12198]SQH71691.1 glycosyltransferase [Helicobacter mustelae]STP12816.1 glycosyltransferase [Helicobacter mustelae]